MTPEPAKQPPKGEPPLPGVTPAAPDDTLPYSGQRPPVAFGVLIWVVLLVLALIFRSDLEADGHAWWIWTCVTGIVLGGLGYSYVHSRHDRL